MVQEVHQVFGPYAQQTVRLHPGAMYAEIEYVIGPIDISDNFGKEIVSVFETNIAADQTFYTDANGREMQKRQINVRPSGYPFTVFEPVSGNYYPINSAAYLDDTNNDLRFLVLTDRSQGGGCVEDGKLEIMLHRRLLFDDGRGVGEPLNEMAFGRGLIIKASHYVIIGTRSEAITLHRTLEERLSNPLVPLFAPTPSFSSWQQNYLMSASLLPELPPNIRLQTLKRMDDGTVLLRLNHMYEKLVHPMSSPVNVSLDDYFLRPLSLTTATEVTLTANAPISELKNHEPKFRVKNSTWLESFRPPPHEATFVNNVVQLWPMQIRTFILS